MSLANKISVFRILLVPGMIAALVYYHPTRDGLRFVALGLFIIGIASDAIDGFLARRHNQQTELGTLLDPIADKCLIVSALISCSAPAPGRLSGTNPIMPERGPQLVPDSGR